MNKQNSVKTRLIRLPEVLTRTGFRKAWIYHLIKEGNFPSQVKTGARSVAFIESEIDVWIENIIQNTRNGYTENNFSR